MADKYFAYSPDTEFDTFETAELAEAAALESIQSYRDVAAEGWDQDVGLVCWGEIKQHAVEFDTGKQGDFDGELVDMVDYKLVNSQKDAGDGR